MKKFREPENALESAVVGRAPEIPKLGLDRPDSWTPRPAPAGRKRSATAGATFTVVDRQIGLAVQDWCRVALLHWRDPARAVGPA